MKKNKVVRPPLWAQRFLAWYCRPELLEDLQGDLNEYFDRHCKTKGLRRARLVYILDVFKFFRSYTLRKPEIINLLIHWIMIGSYIKTSSRSIVRNRVFSSINIIGLSISMSTGLLIVALLTDLLSYDRFHEKGDRIYRVITTRQHGEDSRREYASTSIRAGKQIQETITGIDKITMLEGGFQEDAYRDENILPLKGFWADESFFNIFTFQLRMGNPTTALREPYSIVLTESTAKKLFSGENPFGKSVKFKNKDYQVTGIVQDPSMFSHMRFEVLVSLSTKELLEKENKEWLSWNNISSNYVYLLLPENSNLETLQANLTSLSNNENINPDDPKNFLVLQPLRDIALGKGLSNSIGPSIPGVIMWVLGGLAFIVILCACFNYTSLSIARSLKRSREVGIRKIIGATQTHVLAQFITEAVIISLLSLVLSFFLFLFLRPHFLSMDPLLNSMVALELSPPVILYFIALALIVGIMAGFLPALFFSKLNTLQILRNFSSFKAFRHINFRKGLIVLQYTFSLLFISITLLGYKQYRHFVTFDLGFKTENVLNIELQGNKADILIKELAEIPGVTAVSRSTFISSTGSYAKTPLKYGNPPDSINTYYNTIDENYLPLHGFTLVAGKTFTLKNVSKNGIIPNEQFLKHFNKHPEDPTKSLGEIVTMDGKDLEIIGIVKDFHFGGADRLIEPFVFRYSQEEARFVNAKIASNSHADAWAMVENAWHKIDPVHTLKATFYDDQIEEAYSQVSALLKIIGFLSFITVSIAALGLFGMVVFTTETRLREISIRKVFGSTERNLIYLLSKGFLFLLLVSALIALPCTYLLFDKIILPNIAYPAQAGIGHLFAGATAVTGIALLMIGSQTFKAARSNPADVLKNE